MIMKIRVTIDTNECDFDSENENSYQSGLIAIDIDGVARWWYKSPSYFVPFTNAKILECNHECGYDKSNKCFDCEKLKNIDECYNKECWCKK